MSDFEERARKAKAGLEQALNDAGLKNDEGERKVKRRMVKRTGAIGSVTAVALIAGIVGFLPNNDNRPTVQVSGNSDAFRLAGALTPFGACDDALDYFQQHAVDFYLQRSGGIDYAEGPAVAGREGDTASDAPVTTILPQAPTATSGRTENLATSPSQESSGQKSDTAAQTPSHSTTNVAEKNVDEPDIVKTDGTHIVTVTRGTVRLLTANGGNPSVRATLFDQAVRSVFLSGDRLVVLRSNGGGVRTMQYPPSAAVGEHSTAVIYDIADVTKPASLGSFEVSGSVVDARMVGTQVRLVTTYTPDVDVTPEYTPNGRLTDTTKTKLETFVKASKIETWTPTYIVRDGSGSEKGQGQLVACDDLGRPEKFAGMSTTSLVTFDLETTFDNRHSAGVVANGNQIYGTASSLYVTSHEWTPGTGTQSTDIHSFGTADDGAVRYQGSGSVPGSLLNQYSMSEHKGALRVATTTSDQRGWINRTSVTQGQVAVLKLQDGHLAQVGLVTGLGAKDNESIQSVRFIGDRGYVTTFRQTDPFYVLDLSDPATPKVTGELKIPGFSSYLHPISENLILGVGQSGSDLLASDGGAVSPTTVPRPSTGDDEPMASKTLPGVAAPDVALSVQAPASNGVEFSLFDVRDPANPKKVSAKQYGVGNAGAQYDTKAFLYYEPMNLIVSPLTEWSSNFSGRDKSSGMWSGLVLLRPTDSGLVEVGRLQNSDGGGFNVERTFIIQNNVYQLSQGALQVNSLDTHKQIARVTL
jgi:uncharacterized secreted protein with C-terminal beta-propeller domain